MPTLPSTLPSKALNELSSITPSSCLRLWISVTFYVIHLFLSFPPFCLFSVAVDLKRDSEEKAALHASEIAKLQEELQRAEEARSVVELSLTKHEETFKLKTKEMAQLIDERDSEVKDKSATIQEMV